MLKLFRRIEPAPNPEFEIGRFLSDRGFPRIPALAGAIEYHRPSLEPGTLGVVQSAVKHQGSGWEFTIDELRRYYERVVARIGDPAGQGRTAGPGASGHGRAISRRRFRGARTLVSRERDDARTADGGAPSDAGQGDEPAFAPEPLDRGALDDARRTR